MQIARFPSTYCADIQQGAASERRCVIVIVNLHVVRSTLAARCAITPHYYPCPIWCRGKIGGQRSGNSRGGEAQGKKEEGGGRKRGLDARGHPGCKGGDKIPRRLRGWHLEAKRGSRKGQAQEAQIRQERWEARVPPRTALFCRNPSSAPADRAVVKFTVEDGVRTVEHLHICTSFLLLFPVDCNSSR